LDSVILSVCLHYYSFLLSLLPYAPNLHRA
jgi:hypothetical protein